MSEHYGHCEGCGERLYPTGERGRPRKYCEHCRPVQVQQGRPMAWEVDRIALKRACEVLGITSPVHVKRSPGRSLAGAYHGRKLGALVHRHCDPVQSYHCITVSAVLHPNDASRTLWHELTHAAQSERDPAFHKKYDKAEALQRCKSKQSSAAHRRYKALPWEVEARANSGLHDDVGPLTVAVGLSDSVEKDTREEIEEARKVWDGGARDILRKIEQTPADKLPDLFG